MKLLDCRAAGEAVHVLRFLGRPEGRDDEALGVAALEEGAAVDAGQDADFACDRAKALRVAAVGADAALEHRLAVGFVLQVLEHDVEVDVRELALAELGDEGCLGFFLDGFDVGGADAFFLAEDGAPRIVRTGTTRSMMARASGVAPTSGKVAFGLPASATQIRIAVMIGWIAWWANSRASMKRSSGIWSAEPSIMSMSFSLPT